MAIRNIAIIAHVDHWKTTLVDALLTQSGTMKVLENQTLIMDSNDQEKERWITIYSKNTSVVFQWDTINIIDTPWHADFGSEVERVLKMIDSVLLVVDAYEWPMPQTKFVLKKSLELWLKPIVVINKIDKETARPERVLNQLFDLFLTLWATDEQADFPIIYCSAKWWYAFNNLNDIEKAQQEKSIIPIFELIKKEVPESPNFPDKPLRMQIANLAYDDYLGRLWIGRIYEWTIKSWQQVTIIWNDGMARNGKIWKIFTTLWIKRVESNQAFSWDIITISGIPSIFVWETIWTWDVEALPSIAIDEPTLKMEFLVNDSPFAGKEWKYMTTRNMSERLLKEAETNVWLNVEINNGKFMVSGRWELHLSVLIENIRREWRELQVWAPQVIFKETNGKKEEPIENLVISVNDELSGTIIKSISNRKWLMKDMKSNNWLTTIEFEIPTRWLLWFRWEFILITKWEWIMYSSFSHYDTRKWEIKKRDVWSMISSATWQAMNYGIFKLQERWPIFAKPAQAIYEGMIVWEHLKGGDMTVNLTINKQQNNVRNSGNDEAMRLAPIREITLEYALWYIWHDELVEITPQNIRIRKKYLNDWQRKIAEKNNKSI
jgi:GTP-binding protein